MYTLAIRKPSGSGARIVFSQGGFLCRDAFARYHGGNTLKAFGRSTNGFAWGGGGGLDLNVGRHIAIRVMQADYLWTRLSTSWFNDFRLGLGIVFKFGER